MAVVILLAAGCGSLTDPCHDPGVISSWRYAGVQDVPEEANLTGTLSMREACGMITGELDLVEVDGFGQSRRLAGPLTGRVVDAGLVRFDVLFDGVVRQHLARMSGDSLVGTWLALSDGAGQAWTGSFTGAAEGAR